MLTLYSLDLKYIQPCYYGIKLGIIAVTRDRISKYTHITIQLAIVKHRSKTTTTMPITYTAVAISYA